MRGAATVIALCAALSTTLAGAACLDPSEIPGTRAAIETACPCAAASSPRAHGDCARQVIAVRVSGGLLDPSCVKDVRRCEKRSTCGRPGTVACCVTKRDAVQCRVTTPEGCAARAGCAGTVASCCDACGPGGCVTTTTSTPTSTTLPLCGNGVIDAGEQCDGGVFCSACRLLISACCDVEVSGGAVCSRDFTPEPGPPSCLEPGAVTHYGAAQAGGASCPEAGLGYGQGPCGAVTTFPPTTFCCNRSFPCSQTTLSDSAALVGWLLTSCDNGFGVHPAMVGTCGADFLCHPD